MRKTPLPYRVWEPKGGLVQLGAYPGSWLMGADVPQLLGYHGNELRAFDDLFGGKNDWRNQTNLALLELFAVRFVVLGQDQTLPGFHRVLGPLTTRVGSQALLYEADTLPPYVRLMAGAVLAPEDQIAPTVANPRFPSTLVAVYSERDSLKPADLKGQLPAPASASARIVEWDAGRMRIAIEGSDPRPLYLVISENWYKDWSARIDGKPAPVFRAQNTLLSVVVPTGAREVTLDFASPEYARGKLISLAALLVALGLMLAPRFRKGTVAHA